MQLTTFASVLLLASGAVAQFDPNAVFSQINSIFQGVGGDTNTAAVDLRNRANSLVGVAFTAGPDARPSINSEVGALQQSANALGATITGDAASRISQATNNPPPPPPTQPTGQPSAVTAGPYSGLTAQPSATGNPVTGVDPSVFPSHSPGPNSVAGPPPGTATLAPSTFASTPIVPPSTSMTPAAGGPAGGAGGSPSSSPTPTGGAAHVSAPIAAGVAGVAGVIGLFAVM